MKKTKLNKICTTKLRLITPLAGNDFNAGQTYHSAGQIIQYYKRDRVSIITNKTHRLLS